MGTTVDRDWNIFNDGGSLLNLGTYGILILNRPIDIPAVLMSQLWSKACCRVTVDGGTDRWFTFIKEHGLSLPHPNYVTGDFDSIKPETKEFCTNQDGITVLDCFLAVCENSGRLDQIFSNLNTLYRASLNGYLLSEMSISWMLHPGRHRIHIPPRLCNQKELCGILPLSKPAKVSSKGLKWNLNEQTIEFGGLISSSNTYDGSPIVEVTTDSTVVWSMSY